ncbi:PqqD family protein [Bacillus sp. JCM 19041]|uniref:PqqD family protein n=1 Tax=Bacillus sp. JCM 19041 TaxID=1460637 RepID=UPI0006D19FA4
MEPFNSENIMNADINLNEEVEFLYGANNEPMLYHKSMKNYIRLSKNGALVVNYLINNKSVETIVEELSIQFSQPRKEVLHTMVKFLTQLREANVLNYNSLQSENKIYKSILKRPMLSYTFKGNFKSFIHLSNLFMMKLSRKHLSVLAILIALLGASYLIMYFYFGGFQRRGSLNIPLLLGLFFYI